MTVNHNENQTTMNQKTAAFYNLGCKVNDFDTESMKGLFIDAGYQIVDFNDKADVYVVNTCTVTHLGDRKSRNMLRRARKKNEKAVIVAAGCYAQVASKEIEKIDEVDIIIGTRERGRLVAEVEAFMTDHKRRDYVSDITAQKTFEDLPIAEHRSHTRAFIKVQDGCNQFCSYCIVPYARGRIRSRSIDSVCKELSVLVRDGFQEFVLSGIHIASWGKDLPGDVDLLTLIQAAAAIPGVKRIRLGSIEPLLMSERFVKGLSEIDAFCPHFHLSLQSGSDAVLKRMNRHYTAEQFAEIVARIRRYFDRPALTTDIIVGFPGETDDEFRETVAFVDQINFYQVHVFKYSRRKGTPAAAMPGQVDAQIKHARSQKLIALSHAQEQAFLKENDGVVAPVLFEQTHDDGVTMLGHTPNYIPVAMPYDEKNIGTIQKIVLKYQKDQRQMTGTYA